MKRNRIVTLIAGMVLSTTLAVSSPLTAFGTDFFDNAGAGDTETYEDSMYVGADEFSEEDYSDEDYSEDDYSEESDGLGEDEQPAIVYTVTYDMNGHGESYTEDVEEGFSAVGPEDLPMDDGYEFLGWFTDKKCQTPWDGVVTSNMTVYAGWEEIPQEPEEQEAPAEEPEVVETPQQTEEAGGGETEATEEAAGAAGQEEDAGGAGTGEQTAQTENGNTTPSENTAGAGTTAQEIAEEGDGENVTEEAANAENEDSIFKTQPKEEIKVDETKKAEFKVELKDNIEGIDSSKVTYQWYKEADGEGGEDTAITGNDTAKTPNFVIESVKKEDEGSYFCRVSHDGQPLEDSESSELIVIADLTIVSQPQDQTVEYPASASFSVEVSDTKAELSYQWHIYDKSTGKDEPLDGESASSPTLDIPSTTKDDDGQKFYCEIKEKDGKTVKSEQATLKISNKDQNKTVLYVGNYALDPSKDGSTAVLDLSLTELGSGKISFNQKSKEITLTNVQFDDATAEYDHKYSPAVGLRLSAEKDSEESYTIRLLGSNSITINKDRKSKVDDKVSAIRFDFKNAKKKAKILFKPAESDADKQAYPVCKLTTIGGKTALYSEGDIDLYSEMDIQYSGEDSEFTGIECRNLTLDKGSNLKVTACGTCVFAHEEFSMRSGAQAKDLTSEDIKSPVKNAVLYAGKKITIDDKSEIIVRTKSSDNSIFKNFSGIESAGDIAVSGDSNVLVIAPSAVYGIKTAGELSLKDSDMNTTAGANDEKSKAYGVVCGSFKISLSKEAKYKVQSVVKNGIAFAALTGKSGNKEQGYQENYTPKKITFETADILVPSAHEISTGSIKNGSKYTYVETVYKKGDTSAPVTAVRFDSTKHDWGDPVYTWSKDYSTVTAKRVCKNYESHVETETVKTTSKKTKEPTCTEKGQTTYTAVFKNSAFKKQTKTVDTGKALGHKFGEWKVITRPTLTAEGKKEHTCERCKKVETAVIPKLTKGTYKVEKGASLEWTKGSGKSLEVKVIRETENKTAFSHFQGILVDGKVLKKDYYKAKSGSVVITFKKDFLSKLAVGTHTLTYGFEDGDNPTSKLVIKSATSNSNSKTSSGTSGKGTTSAKTGDTTNIFLWVLTLCAAGAAVFLIQRYKRNNKNKDQDEDTGSDSTKK